jgi:hypothetical protein
VGPDCGVVFDQVDFTFPGLPEPLHNSNWGRITVYPDALAESTGMTRGYLNVNTDAVGWVVANLLIDQAHGSEPVSAYFTLFYGDPEDVPKLDAHVVFSLEPLEIFTDGTYEFDVGDWEYNAQGFGGGDITEVGPPPPPIVDELMSPPNESWVLPNPVNVQTAKNQCFPMAIANSLQFLEETYNFAVPNEHIPGQDGDSSLVGQLDLYSGRSVTDRCNGSGLGVTPMLTGKFQYLYDNNLAGCLVHKHQGSVYENFEWAESVSVYQGEFVTWEWIRDQIIAGEDVELGYVWSTGGHAIRVFGCGETEGERWIRYLHDANQAHGDPANPQGDDAGLETVQVNVSDLDSDGDLNLGTVGREIIFALSESVKESSYITICKSTDPFNDTQPFDFEWDQGEFTLHDCEDPCCETFGPLAPGNYTFTESELPDWYLRSISCTGAAAGCDFDLPGHSVTIHLGCEENVTCTFNNEERGKITVHKNANGLHAASAEFDYSIEEELSGHVDYFTITDNGEMILDNLVPQQYNLTELEEPGWELITKVITDDGITHETTLPTAYLILDPGEEISVTYNNVELGTIKVKKVTIPSPDPRGKVFEFTGDVAGTAMNGETLEHSGLFPTPYGGPYSSIEVDPMTKRWELVSIILDDGGSANPSTSDLGAREAIFNLDPGETVTATFTNLYIPPEPLPAPPEPGGEVGITVMPIDKAGLLLPWFSLAGLLVLVSGTWLFARRRIKR